MNQINVEEKLKVLFSETGQAHHQAFLETDGEDPEWPMWYAGYIHGKVDCLVAKRFTKSQLIYMVVDAENERNHKAPESAWPEFYAQYFSKK